jgi:hypothetical protein
MRWMRALAVVTTLAVRPGSAIAEPVTQRDDDAEPSPPAARLRISTAGECPGGYGVAGTIENLIPKHVAEVVRRDPKISVADMGATYKVSVLADGVSHERIYRDVGRDCAQRSRVAAVFIVLTLMPPEVLMESPPTSAAPAAPPPPPPVLLAPPAPPTPQSSLRLSLSLAGVVDVAPAVLDAPSSSSWGGELRLALRRHNLAGELGVGVQPRADLAFGALGARQQRLPLDVSLAFQRPLHAIELGAAAGIAAAVFHVEGVDLATTRGGTRIDLGVRVGAGIRVGTAPGRLAAFAGVHALYFPRPYELATRPGDVVGRTPSLWVGANAGVLWPF